MSNNSQEEKKHWRKEVGSKSDSERAIQRIKHVGNKLLSCAIILVCVIALIVGIFFAIRAIGGWRLRSKTQSGRPGIERTELAENVADDTQAIGGWQEDWIRYNGKVYEYNDNLMTFLVMGIDKDGEVQESSTAIDGGQADAIFLVVANPDEKKLSLIGINRDTMVEINAVGVYGEGTQASAYAQIAVQHGYGDGKELSCQLMETAVSNLFYQLPINGYVSINMDAIPELNDAVGGVYLTAIEDVYVSQTELIPKAKIASKGQELHLTGTDAYYYVRYRNKNEFESARLRLARQKQYLEGFLNQAKSETKKNLTLPVSVYQKLSKYMVTDITVDEISYLASELVAYDMDPNGIYTLEGETKMGPISEEFYPDQDALVDLMIRVFYREVTTQ